MTSCAVGMNDYYSDLLNRPSDELASALTLYTRSLASGSAFLVNSLLHDMRRARAIMLLSATAVNITD